MSAIAWDGGTAWDGGILWAQGVGEVVDLSASGLTIGALLGAGAVTEDAPLPSGTWPANGVRAIAPVAGPDPEPIKLVHQYTTDREVYEVDFDAKYLAQVNDAAATLAAFTKPAYLPAESRVAVGGTLSTGVVMFAVGPGAPVGTHEVVVEIATHGGRRKACVLQVVVKAP